jgi:hypothetical protein
VINGDAQRAVDPLAVALAGAAVAVDVAEPDGVATREVIGAVAAAQPTSSSAVSGQRRKHRPRCARA